MGVRLRVSLQSLRILNALLVRPSQWHHGYALSQSTGVASGTLYPVLMRLERLGWLETRWEESKIGGRPPRHLYRLTPQGRLWAREELAQAEARKFLKPAYEGA